MTAQAEQLEQAQSAGITTFRSARVNLLPQEVVEGRRLKKVQAGLGGGLALVLCALGGLFVLEASNHQHAQAQLDSVRTETGQLQKVQDQYADVPRTVAAIDAASTARQTAMSQDVEWYRVFSNVSYTLPSNVWLRGATFSLGTPGAAASGTAAASTTATTGASSAAGIGTVNVQGTALSHPDVATWLDALGRQPGMADPYFSSATEKAIGKKTVVEFESSATLTAEALSHRFDRGQD